MFPTILIVDDEPSILQSLGGLLTDEGFVIMTASNGYDALKMIDQESPDLVLLDVRLPDIGGVDVLQRLKDSGDARAVIMITADPQLDVIRPTNHRCSRSPDTAPSRRP